MTVLYEVAPSSTPGDDAWFHNVGTTPPTVAIGSRKFLACVFMAGCAATSTLTPVTPADAVALRTAVARPSTLPALLAESQVTPDDASVAAVLQRLRRISGLSWGDVGRAVGVSRRTIHNWLGGARVAGVHLTRLLELSKLVEVVSTGVPETTRALLLQPTANGRSVIDDLAMTARPVRSRPLTSVSVGDLITPTDDAATVTPPRPERRSSLRGRSVAPRQSD